MLLLKTSVRNEIFCFPTRACNRNSLVDHLKTLRGQKSSVTIGFLTFHLHRVVRYRYSFRVQSSTRPGVFAGKTRSVFVFFFSDIFIFRIKRKKVFPQEPVECRRTFYVRLFYRGNNVTTTLRKVRTLKNYKLFAGGNFSFLQNSQNKTRLVYGKYLVSPSNFFACT